MSTGVASRGLTPALIVPDEQTWTMLGHDPARLGAEPSFEAARTAALLLPERIPEDLDAPLAAFRAELTGGEPVHRKALDLPGSRSAREHGGGGDGAHGEHAHGEDEGRGAHAGHGGAEGDHGDMMAIVGEPSVDGLVMESIELRYGPLAIPFPGGLRLEATLDGDVVSKARVTGLAPPPPPSGAPPAGPDPLAPAAWAVALAGAAGHSEPSHLLAVELERAVSHLAWLRALSRLLGWTRLTDHTAAPLAELAAIVADVRGVEGASVSADARLDAAAAGAARLITLLGGSRALRRRLGGRGVVAPARAEELALDGPNARASGLERDVRHGDPLYATLGFEPLLEDGGDALSRTLLRAREAGQAIELAREALDVAGGERRAEGAAGGTVEGPRGTLRAARSDGGWTLAAPGAAGALALAAEAMIGEPWQDALAVLASFDLSPWELRS